MQVRQLPLLLLICCLATVSCRKDTNLELPQPVPGRIYDTTTVERIEGRLESPGSLLLFVYYFYYDSAYRIKRSVMIDFVNGPNPPDTGYYREYSYNGSDSLPYKLVYGNNEQGAPGSYVRDTAFLFYDAMNRLVKDSGTTYNDAGFGAFGYAKRSKTISYISADSFSLNTVIEPIIGGGAVSSNRITIKNINAGTQKLQKFYSQTGALTYTFTTAYDTCKNPFAKALPQVHPYYDYNGYTLGDGEIGWHLPQPFNRIYFAAQPGTTGNYWQRDSVIITCNTSNLPVEMISKDLLSPGLPKIKTTFYY
jgi:hypothetical protein